MCVNGELKYKTPTISTTQKPNNPMTLTNAFSVAINRGKSKKITVMNNNVLHSL